MPENTDARIKLVIGLQEIMDKQSKYESEDENERYEDYAEDKDATVKLLLEYIKDKEIDGMIENIFDMSLMYI